MPYEDSNRGRVSYVREATFGQNVTDPAFQIARITSSDLSAAKQTTVSEELRSDRMISDVPEVGFNSSGTINGELSGGGTWDSFIEAALGGTYSTATTDTGALAIVATTRTFTLTGAFGNLAVGDWVLVGGMATEANNGWWEVSDISGAPNSVVVLDPGTALVDETGPGTATVGGASVQNGVTAYSYQMEQAFLTNEIAQLYQGMRVGSWNLNVASGSIVTTNFGFMGTEVQAEDYTTNPSWLGSGSYTTPTTSPIFNATANVGTILVDGTPTTSCIQSIDLTLDNALRDQMCVGNKFPQGIGYGRQTITGTMNVFFEDTEFYNYMLNHTNISLEFGFQGVDGSSGLHISLPKIVITSDNPTLPGIDQDVVEPIEFQALVNDAGTYQIQVDVA